MSNAAREELVYVLFASQTGNSEQAARDICDQIPEKLSPQQIQKLTAAAGISSSKANVTITTKSMQLDDFLEIEHAPWTRLVILCLSSYGVGQAPLGGYRFREFCDALIERDDSKEGLLLEGVTFALLGLGDSKYTTFFQNPTKTNEALVKAGAKRVGEIGKADHSGDQIGAIEKWIGGIWKELAKVVVEEPTSKERLKEAQNATIDLCREINPDFMPEKDNPRYSVSVFIFMALMGAILAYVIMLVFKNLED